MIKGALEKKKHKFNNDVYDMSRAETSGIGNICTIGYIPLFTNNIYRITRI